MVPSGAMAGAARTSLLVKTAHLTSPAGETAYSLWSSAPK